MAQPRRQQVKVVGRRGERAQLRRFLGGSDGPRALVIEGEPGIGKTTLWLEAVASARRRNLRVLVARPAEPEARATYAVLADLFSDDAVRDAASAIPAHQRAALEAAVTGTAGVSAAAWQLVGLALVGVLRSASDGGRRVLLAIDDVQWADRPSLRVLEFALRRIPDLPVLLLATRRVAIRRAAGAVPEPLASLEPMKLVLGPLAADDLRSLLAPRRGAATAGWADRLHAASAGNPFIALEMARGMDRDDELVHAPPPVGRPALSARLRQLARAHVAALDDKGLRAAIVAAAMSRPTVELLERAVGDPDLVTAGIENAESAGVLELDHGGLTFTHPLLAAAVYVTASKADRRSLHARLAAIVTDPEERAWHHALSVRGYDPTAATALTTAARLAIARPAPDSALELLTEALALTDPGDVRAWADRSIELARLLLILDRSREAFSATDAVAKSTVDDEVRAAALELAGEAALKLTGPLEAARFAEEALLLTSNPADAVRIGEKLADLLWPLGRQSELAARWRWNVRQAEASGDATLVTRARVGAIADEFTRGRRRAPSALRSMRKAAAGLADHDIPIRVHTMLALVAQWADDPATAQAEWTAIIENAQRTGNELQRIDFQGYSADLSFRTGEWDHAVESAKDGANAITEADAPISASHAHAILALVAAARGQDEAARASANLGLELARDYPWLQARNFAALGFLDLARGQPDGARRWLDAAARADPALLLRRHGACWVSVDRIEAQAAGGAVGDARETLATLEEEAAAWGDGWIGAAVARSRGHVLAAEGRPDDAAAAADEAVERYQRLPYPLELGRALLLAGTLHRRLQHRQAARQALGRAERLFADLGAAPWLAQVRAELARVSGRAPSRDGLTGSELAVARLVARGMSNAEVARELVLTIRTVESHLTQIYGKLGLRSRTELARALLTGAVPAD